MEELSRAMLFFVFFRVLLFSSLSINSSTSVMANVTNLSAIFAGNFKLISGKQARNRECQETSFANSRAIENDPQRIPMKVQVAMCENIWVFSVVEF